MSTSNSPITISSLDYERIETLLESDAAQNVPGIEALESELLRANVVEPSEVPPGLVTMNTTVKFEDLGTGQHRSLTLVYPHNATAPDSISVLTPVGAALIGLAEGQSIGWEDRSGRRQELTVVSVAQPEAEVAQPATVEA
mgnify:CR=1 FL=1